MKKKNQFAVIGLGSFGASLCKTLTEMNKEVLVIDNKRDLIEDIKDYATHAVCADAADEQVLRSLGIIEFDTVVVCIGDTEANVFVTLLCKQLGVKKVVAKANNALHKTVLEKIGADMVIFPEEYMGKKVASILTNPGVLELAEISPQFRIFEILTPKAWADKTLQEINIRHVYGVTVLAIKRSDKIIITPAGDQKVLSGDELIMCGSREDFQKLNDAADVEIQINL